MRIKSLETKNFRTLEDFKLSFNSYYTAISGKNNAGKSNILRLIQELLQDTPRIRIRGRSMGVSQFNWMEDVTSWNIDRKDDITICATFEINRDSDASIYKFLTDFIVKEGSNLPSEETKTLKIGITKKPSNLTQYSIFVDDVEITDDYSKKEFLMRFRSADCLSYYNSTMRAYNPFEDDIETVSDFLSSTDLDEINKKKEDLIKLVSKNLKSHQQELTQWLGKLEEKYEVCLSIQGLNFEKEPIDISLKEKGGEVLLDNWGSGTRMK